MSRLVVVLLLLAAPFAPGPLGLEGQEIPSPYRFFEKRQEAGVFAGYVQRGTGLFGFGPKSSVGAGARYSIQLGGPFALEGVGMFTPTTRDIVDPSAEEGSRVLGEADAQLLSFDLRLRFSLTGDRTWRGLHPYIFFGGGVAFDIAGDVPEDGLLLPEDQFDFGSKFVAPFGAGLRWFVTERLIVRTDFTINLYRLSTPPGFLDPERDLPSIGEREWVSGPGFTLGFAIQF
jgi:hypothetical protein